jgi:rhamnosyl/mannosyltransferase
MALPAAQRLPRVVHWHSDVVTSGADRRLALAYGLYRPLEQRLLDGSRVIIATSPTYLEASPALGPWRPRCEVVPLGLDATRLPDPDAWTLEQSGLLWRGAGLRILAVGRLTYYKGFDRLVQAMSDLPEAQLLVVGSGDEQTRLTALIRARGLTERVKLLGFRTDADVHGLLATCDVLCLPSLERTEAFGLVLLEAMRFGKPVVASDIPGSGTGWVVRLAGHGLLTVPGDPGSLAGALRRLDSDPLLRRGLGARGAAALGDRFGIATTAEAIAGLYRRLEEQASD